MWPDRRIIDLFKTEFPIVLAPMAGVVDAELVIAAAQGGALGSLPCAMLSAEKAREQVNIIRQRVSAPINLNFFCHQAVEADPKREATWLEENGADVIIAQGAEAGGHRGMFLTDNIAEQPGTFALVPQVVDAVKVPVIAAGGIADGRGIAAAFALGASGVQIGTAY